MDNVLLPWSPIIDWSRFEQGAISDKVWASFKQLVQFCHAFCHWEQDGQNKRASPPRHYTFPPEDKRQFKKRRDQWDSDIRQSETYMHRAGYLADETIAKMSYLIGPDPDWKLSSALRGAVGRQPRLRCKA